MIFSLIVGFVLGAATLFFALQNTEVVSLTFLMWQFESSLALLVILSVTMGVLISILASIPSALSASFKMMSLKKENRKLVQEVDAHREALTAVASAAEPQAPVVDLRN